MPSVTKDSANVLKTTSPLQMEPVNEKRGMENIVAHLKAVWTPTAIKWEATVDAILPLQCLTQQEKHV